MTTKQKLFYLEPYQEVPWHTNRQWTSDPLFKTDDFAGYVRDDLVLELSNAIKNHDTMMRVGSAGEIVKAKEHMLSLNEKLRTLIFEGGK